VTGGHHRSAVSAWRALGVAPQLGEPSVEPLQKRRKGMVYRLAAAGPSGCDVIGKWSTDERIRREAVVYERVLTRLPVSRPQYFGCIAAPDGDGSWLFVSYAGDESYRPRSPHHRMLAARWLADLHCTAARAAPGVALPRRGPPYYLAELETARSDIARHLADVPLTPPDAAVLARIVRGCDVVARHWDAVEAACRSTPSTLVHGDFAPKNLRVRGDAPAPVLEPFDWASAGWGTPAADLPQLDRSASSYWAAPDLDVYLERIAALWPGVTRADLRRLAALGKVFRTAVCLNLEAAGFVSVWPEAAMRDMRYYRADLDDAIRALGWAT
jgi:hypothetical protein